MNPNRHQGDFLPNLCSVQAVFHLVLVGELLAIALAIADRGVLNFNWYRLGVISMLIQWVVLTSAACLCPMRPWLRHQKSMVAGLVCWVLVMSITAVYSYLGLTLQTFQPEMDWNSLLTNFLLASVFSGIVLRYFYLQQQLRNQQQAELTARIQALQSRIRPHFLFNSMNSIASLIDFDPKAAEKMVIDLSDLFRVSLSEPGLIPLERELELCKRFVSIEHARIGDRLTVDWDIQSQDSVQIPSLLLQPLVENAIYHGIQPLPEGGIVSVRVYVEQGICHIRVSNPVGDKNQVTSKGNGLALENIRNRLVAHYGTKGLLDVEAEPDSYTVNLSFPASPPVISH